MSALEPNANMIPSTCSQPGNDHQCPSSDEVALTYPAPPTADNGRFRLGAQSPLFAPEKGRLAIGAQSPMFIPSQISDNGLVRMGAQSPIF